MTGWFNVDFPASIPVDWVERALADPDEPVESGTSPNRIIRAIRILRFLKFARVLRVGKLGAFMESFEQELVGSKWRMLAHAIGKIIVFLLFVSHLSACLWYLVGVSYYVYSNFRLTLNLANFWQTLRGSFSAVSKPNFAGKE